ncbi:hypothetical protein DFJ63DRAFT_319814 [Scheffersomyces coipomensis]|uniref:uncharacterized protein n=1 Tax=Scheffersomyces coipomensis TaxID=1788519 RepID=UPI00315CA56C
MSTMVANGNSSSSISPSTITTSSSTAMTPSSSSSSSTSPSSNSLPPNSISSSHNNVLLNLSSHPDWVSMDMDKLGKSFYNGEDQPLNDHIKNLKIKSIQESISSSSHSNQLDNLINYSRSNDGLINNDFRSIIWPILLGMNYDNQSLESSSDSTATIVTPTSNNGSNTNSSTKLNAISASFFLEYLNNNDLLPHKDEDQVKLDIQRSFTILNHIQSLQSHLQNESYTTIFSPSDMNELKKKLLNLIIKILRKYPTLHYYQGFHDIASIILLVCYNNNNNNDSHEDNDDNDSRSSPTTNCTGNYNINEELAFKLLERFTIFHLRDFMINDITLSTNHLKLIPTLLEIIDPTLFELIKQTSNQYLMSDGLHYDYNFYQSLSCILTLYSHDISNIQHLLILWDFILSYNSIIISVYIYVATLLYVKDELFSKLNIDDETDNYDFSNIDPDLVHTLTSPTSLFDGLSDNGLIKILNKAKELIETYPIEGLKNANSTFDIWFNQFNPHSVLLTSSNINFDNFYKFKHYEHLLINDVLKQTHNNISFSELLQSQEDEIAKQTIFDLETKQKILEQQEELANSVISENSFDSHSNPHSLSSSLSLTSTSSSSINSKIAHTSSMIFKKLFKIENSILSSPIIPSSPLSNDKDDKDNKKLINRNKNTHLIFSNIYKISFTIGFIGFLIHFLLIKNNPNFYNHNAFNLFNINSFTSPLKDLSHSLLIQHENPINSITNEISNISADIISDVGGAINDVCTFVKQSEIVHQGINFGQVGLGGLRNTLYGFIT